MEIGSLEWGGATNGELSTTERRSLRRAVLRDTRVYARSRLLLLLGGGSRSASVDLAVMDMPDTDLCRAVESTASALQSSALLAHAYRTVAYAHAIAQLDNVSFDQELLWCAALLHDVEIERPAAGHCFAVRGGQTAFRVAVDSGADVATASTLGDAVSRHATPDLDARTQPLPYLVASGALVDVLGKRLEQMSRSFIGAVRAQHPQGDFHPRIAQLWSDEAKAVPQGRAALVEKMVRFSLAARFAPS